MTGLNLGSSMSRDASSVGEEVMRMGSMVVCHRNDLLKVSNACNVPSTVNINIIFEGSKEMGWREEDE